MDPALPASQVAFPPCTLRPHVGREFDRLTDHGNFTIGQPHETSV